MNRITSTLLIAAIALPLSVIPTFWAMSVFGFSLSLLGTFLVRSGVLVSVHAFATDPERGVFILGQHFGGLHRRLAFGGIDRVDLFVVQRLDPLRV